MCVGNLIGKRDNISLKEMTINEGVEQECSSSQTNLALYRLRMSDIKVIILAPDSSNSLIKLKC